jgi:hypothetical protein
MQFFTGYNLLLIDALRQLEQKFSGPFYTEESVVLMILGSL